MLMTPILAYAGHAFRKSSATLDMGHWGWKSETFAEDYVAEILSNKPEIAHRILKSNNVPERQYGYK